MKVRTGIISLIAVSKSASTEMNVCFIRRWLATISFLGRNQFHGVSRYVLIILYCLEQERWLYETFINAPFSGTTIIH